MFFWILMLSVWAFMGGVVVGAFGGIGALLYFFATLAVLVIIFET